jgi:hypothetical protein
MHRTCQTTTNLQIILNKGNYNPTGRITDIQRASAARLSTAVS